MNARDMSKIRIGTRGSALALKQAEIVRSLLLQKFPEINFQIFQIKTSGDRDQNTPLAQMGGTGVFVKEIELALKEDKIDIAVHSAKDLPASLPEGFGLPCVLERGYVEDVLISREGKLFDELPPKSVIATSSVRRRAYIRHIRPDLEICDVRGNVDTRLRKLHEGEFDAIILARAGLQRLGLSNVITEILPRDKFIPAPGQGIIAIEALSSRNEIGRIVSAIDDKPTYAALEAERSLLRNLKAGCSSAIGGLAEWVGDALRLRAVVLDNEGSKMIRAQAECNSMHDAASLGAKVAGELLKKGVAELMSEK